jgi:hypothetical protein
MNKIFSIIIIILFSFSIISCQTPAIQEEKKQEEENSLKNGEETEDEPKYTAEEWRKIEEEKLRDEEEDARKAKVANYEKRLSEYYSFASKLNDIQDKYNPDIISLYDKATKTNNNDEKIEYWEQVVELYEKEIEELSKVSVPEDLVTHYDYFLDGYIKTKLYYECFINPECDSSELSRFESEANTSISKREQELKRVYQKFNEEAEELGLVKTFPEFDSDFKEDQPVADQEKVSEQTSLNFSYSDEFPTTWGIIRVVDPLLVAFNNIEIEQGFFLLSDSEVQVKGQIEGLEHIRNIWMPESGIFTMLSAVILDPNGNIKWEQEGYPLNGSYILEKDIKDFRLVSSYNLPVKSGDYLILIAYMEGGMMEDDLSFDEDIDRGVFGFYKTQILIEN